MRKYFFIFSLVGLIVFLYIYYRKKGRDAESEIAIDEVYDIIETPQPVQGEKDIIYSKEDSKIKSLVSDEILKLFQLKNEYLKLLNQRGVYFNEATILTGTKYKATKEFILSQIQDFSFLSIAPSLVYVGFKNKLNELLSTASVDDLEEQLGASGRQFYDKVIVEILAQKANSMKEEIGFYLLPLENSVILNDYIILQKYGATSVSDSNQSKNWENFQIDIKTVARNILELVNRIDTSVQDYAIQKLRLNGWKINE